MDWAPTGVGSSGPLANLGLCREHWERFVQFAWNSSGQCVNSPAMSVFVAVESGSGVLSADWSVVSALENGGGRGQSKISSTHRVRYCQMLLTQGWAAERRGPTTITTTPMAPPSRPAPRPPAPPCPSPPLAAAAQMLPLVLVRFWGSRMMTNCIQEPLDPSRRLASRGWPNQASLVLLINISITTTAMNGGWREGGDLFLGTPKRHQVGLF